MKKLFRTVSVTTGVLFILTGAFKALMVLPGEHFIDGRRAFAEMLLQIGVPLPFVVATAIPALEIIGGIGLISGRGARVWAALLTMNMIGAILLVGIPGKAGRVFSVGNTVIGGESWRLPLEIALLLMMVWLVFFHPQKAHEERDLT